MNSITAASNRSNYMEALWYTREREREREREKEFHIKIGA